MLTLRFLCSYVVGDLLYRAGTCPESPQDTARDRKMPQDAAGQSHCIELVECEGDFLIWLLARFNLSILNDGVLTRVRVCSRSYPT